MGDQERQPPAPPSNLQDVLKMAIAATPENPNPEEPAHTLETMDPERRQWLEQVFESMGTTSMVKEMQKSLAEIKQALQSSDPTDDSALYIMEIHLEKLMDITTSIDHAIDFEKIGGFSVISPLLDVESPNVRSQTSELVAVLCQNNPYCQQAALKAGLMPKLLHLLDTDPDEIVTIKALYAISCLIRQNAQMQEEFEKLDGFSPILRAMQRTGVPKLRTKAAFLLSSMCTQTPRYRDTLFRMGFVEQLAGLLHGDHDASHEHLLSLLLALASEHEPSRSECRRSDLNLQPLLTERISLLGGKDEHREEQEYCHQIMNLCFSNDDHDR